MTELISSSAIEWTSPMRSCRPDRFLARRPAAWRAGAILSILCLATGLLGALGVGAAAVAATPVGNEFQVNTYTTDFQQFTSVALDASGDFVVVWESFGSAGSDTELGSIQARRYDADGDAVGSDFQVNTYTTSDQRVPSVSIDAAGNFVVVWNSYGSTGNDTSLNSIQAQRYDASGNALGSQFQVNTYTTGGQWLPSVAVAPDGDFVVVWESRLSAGSDTSYQSIQGQRYDPSGNAVGSQFQVNTYTTSAQRWPSVAVDADGDFVVVWWSFGSAGSDTSLSSIQGQRYGASGNPVGSEFQINTYTTDNQMKPRVAVDPDGDFVVVWESYGSAGSDTSDVSIQGQRYDASGNAAGSEFQVNTYTTDAQWSPSVAVDADGDFVVVWHSYGGTGTDTSLASVQGQRYGASGNAVGSQFQVNTYTTSYQRGPFVAAEAGGDFVVVWESYGSAGGDTSYASIQGRRYTVAAPQVPSLAPPGVIGLAVLLLGIAAVALREKLRGQA